MVEKGDNETVAASTKSSKVFNIEYQWQYVNFTWPSYADYRRAVTRKHYIPENVAITGIKYYKDNIYVDITQKRKS